MRFYVSILCACLLISLLGGCTAKDIQESSDAPTVPAIVSASNEPKGDISYKSRLFGQDWSYLVSRFSDYFGKTEYPNAFASEPQVLDGGQNRNAYIYTIDKSSQLYFYTGADDDKLLKVVLMGNSKTMDDYAAHTFVCYAASLLGYFGGDSDESEQLMESLAIFTTPTDSNAISFYTGAYSDFSYTVVDGILTLTIESNEF